MINQPHVVSLSFVTEPSARSAHQRLESQGLFGDLLRTDHHNWKVVVAVPEKNVPSVKELVQRLIEKPRTAEIFNPTEPALTGEGWVELKPLF